MSSGSRSRFTCPQCGSSHVRRSHARTIVDNFGMLWGSYPLRCQECQHRFRADILMLSQVAFARCPRCMSFALTTWDPKHYRLSFWRKVLLRLGARRHRCSTCRLNFVSFRPAKPPPVAAVEPTA